jgi:hypothetical protein
MRHTGKNPGLATQADFSCWRHNRNGYPPYFRRQPVLLTGATSNRAKSRIAKKILKNKKTVSLDEAIKELTNSIFNAYNAKERLRILIQDWKFSLPMATAILTVLYPDEFPFMT